MYVYMYVDRQQVNLDKKKVTEGESTSYTNRGVEKQPDTNDRA